MLGAGRASQQRTHILIRQSQDICLNSPRAQDEKGSGITLQEEDDSKSPREFLHSGLWYAWLHNLSHAQAGKARLSHTLGDPLGCSAAPSPVLLPDSHARRATRMLPGTTV